MIVNDQGDIWTADTFARAMEMLLHSDNKQVTTIMRKNSLKWWTKNQYDMQDALAEMLSSICNSNRVLSAQTEFVRMFNSGNEMNRWIVGYCNRQLNNNKSIAYRRYYTNRFNDDNYNSNEMEDVCDSELQLSEEKENDVRSYCGKDQLSIMTQMLSAKEAKQLFHPEQLDLFFHFYLSDPDHKIPLISDIAKTVGITRLAAYRLIMPVKKWLCQKMKDDSVKGYLFRADEK